MSEPKREVWVRFTKDCGEPFRLAWVASTRELAECADPKTCKLCEVVRYVPESAQSEVEPPVDNGGAVTVRPVVRWFAEQMELALRRNDHKGGWHGDRPEALAERIFQEAGELDHAMRSFRCSGADVVCEAADVANMAMMVADHFRVSGPSRDQGQTMQPPPTASEGDGDGS